jgi:PBSX family phage terminase large subunit
MSDEIDVKLTADVDELTPVEKPRGKFKKGDPRINRLGRPKSFAQWRKLAQSIAQEPAKDNDGNFIVENGKKLTIGEMILRKQAYSSNPLMVKEFSKAAFGITPIAPAEEDVAKGSPLVNLPIDIIADDFIHVYRDVKAHNHTEYVLYGGRGSTKSSFISLIIIYLLVNNPNIHALVTRQVGNTMRDSVFNQLIWAIGILGFQENFRYIANPMEITYLPTGQKVYFRGGDDPNKLKSIKPPFGYIGVLWFEELDQFNGSEAVRKVEQSVMRGGDLAWTFKSFNPPRTQNNWANQYIKIPKETQMRQKSSYLNVPPDWLGEPWLAEAEHLKKVNPGAYDHEYLGNPNFAGGLVFGNVVIRKITDEEIYGKPDGTGHLIGGFDRPLNGIDWGFYPDPAHYVKCFYSPNDMKLYIYNEVRRYKTSNENFYNALVEEGDYENWEQLICDSAEPKSVADFRSYGALARGAEKGKESVNYSMKWLASLTEIVIDQERAPESAREFLEYEFERTKDDEIISAYPDEKNHAIDATRYATNPIWKRRGQ